MRMRFWAFSLAGLLLPSLAHAHSANGVVTGWLNGFSHPIHGWDHLVVMIAVGLWAAQHRGHARWRIPVAFVGAMAVGGIIGALGLALPFAEEMILISVVVVGALALFGARLGTAASMLIVALFALFHGYVHGLEMPNSAPLATFGVGFLLATALLHVSGYAFARLLMATATIFSPAYAFAQQAAESDASQLPQIVITGRQDSLVGIATSATEGTVGAEQLSERPVMRTGEVLETVPGVIITQHAGGGKANQYFLRGFNLDHGTDFLTTLDGMPVNLPSHGHGQGYSDLNIVIPELIQRVNYQKGVYYADNGDFSSAGAAHLESFKSLTGPMATLEGGMNGYGRIMGADSFALAGGEVLMGADVSHSDGPWVRPDDYLKEIGVVTFSSGAPSDGFSVTARGYHGRWNSSDQIATSAVTTGLIPLYGTLDPTTGGNSQRYSLQGEWHRLDAESATHVDAYAFYYDLNLLSNFTYYLTDPVLGDQFMQRDKRYTTGLNATHTFFQTRGETTVGLQSRNDNIKTDLLQTAKGVRTAKVAEDGTPIPAVTRHDTVTENNVGIYVENTFHWTDAFRTEAGLRWDFFNFNVDATLAANSGTRSANIANPKLSMIYALAPKTEIYVQGGLGYHSNDARGVLTTEDEVTGDPLTPATPLVRSRGAEVGVRTTAIDGLQSTVSLWWLDLDSELVFTGDGGTTEASRPSRRSGIEFANYYTPLPWLTFDADFALSRAQFRDDDPAGNKIPEAIESVIAAGVTVRNMDGFFGSMRLRYFGPRPLIEDNSFRSGSTILLNGQIGYQFAPHWRVTLDVFNILDRKDHDIDYAYESRVTPTATPTTQVHFHPVEPRQVRASLSMRF